MPRFPSRPSAREIRGPSRPLALAAALAVLALGPVAAAPAWAEPPAPKAAAQEEGALQVVPAGQEALLSKMLAAPSGWELSSVAVERERIVAVYRAGAGQARVTLAHPRSAAGAAARTARSAITDLFAITAQLTHPAPGQLGLLEAILPQIRAGEREFRWQRADAMGAPRVAPAPGQGAEAALAEALRLADREIAAQQPQRAEAALKRAEATLAAVAAGSRPAGLASLAWRRLALGQQAAGAQGFQAAAAAGGMWERAAAALAQRQPAQLASQELALADGCSRTAALADEAQLGGRGKEALALLTPHLAALAPCPAAISAVGRLAQRAGQPQQVLPGLQAALALHPGDPRLSIMAANLLRQQGQMHQALQQLRQIDLAQVEAATPESLDLARVLIDVTVGETAAEALNYLGELRRRSDAQPSDAVAGYLVGTVLHHQDAWEESNLYLQRSAQGFALEPRQYLYAAMNHWHLGEQQKAEELVARAWTLERRDPDLWYCRAKIVARSQPALAADDVQHYLDATEGDADNDAGKAKRMRAMLEDLHACKGDADPGLCLDLRAARHFAAAHWPWLAAAAGALALLGWLAFRWASRRSRAA